MVLYTVKKRLAIFPSPTAGFHLLIIKLFLAMSLVSDIPAVDGKIADLFL